MLPCCPESINLSWNLHQIICRDGTATPPHHWYPHSYLKRGPDTQPDISIWQTGRLLQTSTTLADYYKHQQDWQIIAIITIITNINNTGRLFQTSTRLADYCNHHHDWQIITSINKTGRLLKTSTRLADYYKHQQNWQIIIIITKTCRLLQT